MAETRRTSIPQFSLRSILILTAICAVIAFVAGQGQRGAAWAAAFSIAVLGIAVSFGMFVLTFMLADVVTSYVARRDARRAPPGKQRPKPGAKGHIAKLLLAASAACLGSVAGEAWGASGGVITLPLPSQTAAGTAVPVVPKSGLTVTIDTNWVDASGYRPVRIMVTSVTGPVTADRVLTFRFHMKNGFSTQDSVTVTQTVEIPQGGTTATATLAVPELAPSGSFEFDTFEDGRGIKELSIPARTGWTSWTGTFQGDSVSPVVLALSPLNVAWSIKSNRGATPEMLVVGQPPSMQPQLPITPPGTPMAPNVAAAPAGSGVPINVPTFAELPTRWIDYTGFDLAVVTLTDLKTLATKHKPQWQAIRNWQRVGGTLLVFELGNDWEKLGELEELLGLTAPKGADSDSEDELARRGWKLPLLRDRMQLKTSPDPIVFSLPAADGSVEVQDAADQPKAEEPVRALRKESEFITREAGLGLIVAIRDKGFALGLGPANLPWDWILNTIGPQRWEWFERYGTSLSRPNEDFWNFLIPGVGLAPVTSFQVLITAFVIAIGPVNYWLLKRHGKLNLLLLTVPISAALVTGALVVFALVSDGLSTRVRVRSLTHFDQTTGEAMCWSRLSFYAGLAPGDGLVFSDDTQVEPLEYAPLQSDSMPTRDVVWAHSDPVDLKSPVLQKLTDGWLVSRTPTQFITTRIRKSKAGIGVDTANSAGATAKNNLGAQIHQLVLADDDGKLFVAQNLADGETAKLVDANSEVGKQIREMLYTLVENTPQRPDSMSRNSRWGFFGLNQYSRSRNIRYGYNINFAGEPQPLQSTSVMEMSLAEAREQLQRGALKPRTYIAIVDRGPEVQIGTPAAAEEASLHVATGKW